MKQQSSTNVIYQKALKIKLTSFCNTTDVCMYVSVLVCMRFRLNQRDSLNSYRARLFP